MKKKRILSLFLAVMMVFLLFTEHTPYSFAEGGGDNLSSKLLPEDVKIKFKDTDKTQIDITPGALEGANGELGVGLEYRSFEIEIDFTRFTSNVTLPQDRLKAGDYVIFDMPANLELREKFFGTTTDEHGVKKYNFELKKPIGGVDTVFAYVEKVGDSKLKILFTDVVENPSNEAEKFNIKAKIQFESTIEIHQDGSHPFEFDIFGKKVTLILNATRKAISTQYILKKDATGDSVTADGDGIFKYILLGNRKQEDLGTLIITDKLENGTPDQALRFELVGFDKTIFEIEEGNFSKVFEKNIDNPKTHYKIADATFEDGKYKFSENIILTFADETNPKSFELLIKNPGTKGYKVSYGIKVPKDDIGRSYTLTNTSSIYDEHRQPMDISTPGSGNTSSIPKRKLNFLASGSIISDSMGRILVRKIEKDTNEGISGAEFKLYKVEASGNTLIDTKTTDSEGRLIFSNLSIGQSASAPVTYEIYETKAPVDYKEIAAPVLVGTANLHKTNVQSAEEVVKAENERKTIDIKVTKNWEGEGATKEDVTFTLWKHIEGLESAKQNVESKELKKDALDDFVEFKDLYEYDGKGNKYIYTVTEGQIEGYTSKVGTLTPSSGDSTLYEVTVTNTKKSITPPPSGGTPPPTPPAGGIGGTTPPPSGDDSTPPPSDGGGSGTPSKVERITPKPPKPEEPKKEDPKPQPPADGIGGPIDPPSEPPADGIGGFEPPSEPFSGITGGGAGAGENDTDVLPGMIPGLTGGGTGAGDPNSAVAPGHIGKLPKTGEGLNASSYALFFGFIGMSFVIYGVYMKRAKKQ